jgi:hypothetical protein
MDSMTDRARELMLWHVFELDALLKRLTPGSIAHNTVASRLEEAKGAFKR